MSNEGPASPVIKPDDGRYPALSRGFNQRWLARPDYIRLAVDPVAVVVHQSP